MKIALISYNPIGRGTYLRAYKFAVELSRLGHEVTIIGTKTNGWRGISESIENNLRVVATPDLFSGALRSGWDPYNCIRRISWLRGNRFDIVHAFESRPTVIFPALYLKRSGAKLVMDWCDWFGSGGAVEERPSLALRTILRPVETYFEEHFRNQAAKTTVICSTLLNRALDLGLPREGIFLLPNGFDMPELHQYELAVARDKLGLSNKDFLIGYVGASFYRDVKLMEKTYEKVIIKIPNAKLVHIGRSNYSINIIEKNKDKIIRTGDVSAEIFNLYLSACNICWLPLSDTDANRGRFPLKLATYLAVGRPVVVTAVGDLVPFFEQYKIGLLSRDEPEAIAQNIFSLYSSPVMMDEMSMNAKNVTNDPKLSWRQRVVDLEKIYLHALSTS